MNHFSICPTMPVAATEVFVGRGLIIRDLIQKRGRKVIVADDGVGEIYGKPLAEQLNALLLIRPPIKSKENYEWILERLFLSECGKDTLLIALGGGAILDLTAFVASTYMRGISLVLIPTTLLAMVDAAIGGKTAIDTPWGKNLVGSIYFPKTIIADLNLLKSLSAQELLNGLAEILKIGLVFDSTIWDYSSTDVISEETIYKAMQAKVSIIEKDPSELGLRRILNFGHTIGHGLEHIGKREISHGMAVALGSLAESHLSMQLGYLSKQDFEKIQMPYKKFPLALPSGYTRGYLIQAMKHDKKKEEGKLRFVLIDQIGRAISHDGSYCKTVLDEELEKTLQWLEKCYG